MSWLRGHWQLLALTALVFALWQTPLVVPLKILIVFLHETSHALAALATGGAVESLTVNPAQGGLTVTRGGNMFVILSAGYLGSLAIGAVILLLALRTHWDRALMGAFGLTMLLITALFIREGFAALFGIGGGVVMLAMAWFLPRDINDMALRMIGLTSLIYVPWDIFNDTIQRAHMRSDAYMLAEQFGGATVLWGGLWLVISMAVIAASLRWGLGTRSNIWPRHN